MAKERVRMLRGEPFDPTDPALLEAQLRCQRLLLQFNSLDFKVTEKLFRCFGSESWITPPFHCEFGKNISIGDHFYANTQCLILDSAKVEIGNHVLLGPGVHIYTTTHPLDAAERMEGRVTAKRVVIEPHVWLGGRSIVLPGVKIGEGAVVGAGSVVTSDIEPYVLAVGNPCRPLRSLKAARAPSRLRSSRSGRR